jgi:hypothetical protein
MIRMTAYEIKKLVESKFPDARVTGMEPCQYTINQNESDSTFNGDMMASGDVIACFFGSVDCLFYEFAASPATKYMELYRATDIAATSEVLVGDPIKSTLTQNESAHYRLENQILTRVAKNGGYHGYTLCGYRITLEPLT